MTEKPDDLEAIRTIIKTLQDFEQEDQERIIRWSREKLGLPAETVSGSRVQVTTLLEPGVRQLAPSQEITDIKAFVAEKSPSSNSEYAATVAYFYKFVAPDEDKKEAITAEDLQESCRLIGRDRFQKPSQTLVNAHATGLLDKGNDRGFYSVSTVGENLVAVTLPSSANPARSRPSTKRLTPRSKTKKPVRTTQKGASKRKRKQRS